MSELETEYQKQIAELEQNCRGLAEEVDAGKPLSDAVFTWALAKLGGRAVDKADRQLLSFLLVSKR